MLGQIKKLISESILVKQQILEDPKMLSTIENVINILVDTFRKENKVLFCGNGGSAADAQHLAAEFTGRFYINRAPLYAEALHVNTSYLTAVANDYSYEEIYSRMVEAMGKPGDILVAMSTSGNSPNIIKAIKKAKDLKMKVIGMTGNTGGNMKDICDIIFNVPSEITPRIQESHMLIGHIICEQVEKILFADK
jgi:D-sedoheptulose 7-phosphate isomerase